MTPAMYAAYHNRPYHLKKLLSLGAGDDTTLSKSAENKIDLEEKDVDGKTAMHWAVHKSDAQCLAVLLEQCACS